MQKLAQRMNNLAYQLQSNPQKFGAKILALQESIAQEEQQLTEKISPDLKLSIKRKKYILSEYLSVVKWLESPEG